jgi:hypothetical protein
MSLADKITTKMEDRLVQLNQQLAAVGVGGK